MKFGTQSKRNKFNFGAANVEKRIVTGPALIPDKKIYRSDMWRGEYEVMFSAEAIEGIRNYFLSNFKQKDVTVDHAFNANNISVVESWVIEDAANDKANALGFKDLPKGTWMISMKVDNDDVWSAVKNNELRGFSIEAYLSQTLIEASVQQFDIVIEEIEEIDQILKDIEDFIEKADKVIATTKISESIDDIISDI
jgi:hypothetical protein